METTITRDAALELLKKYNQDPFHLQHAYTVEGVMRWSATEMLGWELEELLQKTMDAMKAIEDSVNEQMA